ncbi:MAG TPA: hypothetical protein VGR57_11000, partial [Ktedonobacterales bacterium]|nr:hypothetical protein [Ktedonobacterales bacterium]
MSDVGHATLAQRPKTDPGRTIRRAVRGAQSTLPLLTPAVVIFGFLALLDTGFDNFGHSLGDYRAVPIYAFLSVCLLVFQAVLWERHSAAHILFVLGMGLLAIVFAGIYFFGKQNLPINSPPTYYAANALLLLVFLVDAVRRRRAPQPGVPGLARATVLGSGTPAAPARTATRGVFDFIALLAADLIGLCVLFTLSALGVYEFENGVPLLQPVLNLEPVLPQKGTGAIHVPSPIQLPNISDLWQFDLLVAAVALVFGLLCIFTVLWMVRDESEAPGQTGRILREAITQVRHALRPLGFFFWLGASSVITLIALGLTYYFSQLAAQSGNTMLDLFNPLRNFFALDLLSFAVGILLAVAFVIIAAVFTEYDVAIVDRTVATFAATGRRLAGSLPALLLALT